MQVEEEFFGHGLRNRAFASTFTPCYCGLPPLISSNVSFLNCISPSNRHCMVLGATSGISSPHSCRIKFKNTGRKERRDHDPGDTRLNLIDPKVRTATELVDVATPAVLLQTTGTGSIMTRGSHDLWLGVVMAWPLVAAHVSSHCTPKRND